MPRQQTFEGRRLPEVLARVSAEAGPTATIVDARKIRMGGVGGFFAKEHFEVRVEVPDTAAPEEAIAVEPPSSLLELADLVDEAEADVTRHAIGRVPLARVATPVVRRPVEERTTDTVVGPRGAAPAEPAPMPRVLEPVELATVPMPSTESDGFQSVLRRLVADLEPATETPEQETAASFERVPADGLFATAPSPPAHEVDTVDDEPPAPPAHEVDTVDEDPAPVTLPVRIPTTSALAAACTGHPADGTTLTEAIMRTLQLPALPAESGARATIAVVGQGWPALQVAASIAQQVAGPDAEVDAGWEHDRPLHVLFPVGDDAYDSAWTGPTVVAIDAPMGNVDLSWAAQVLEVLDPDLVWGVVDATRKNEDITEWCVDLGGIDVLAVENLDATCSPAAILDLGLPVGLIDRRPATRLAWASLLAERVELSA